MDAGFTHTLLLVVVGFLVYTLLLTAARRAADRRGYDAMSSALSLAWWFVIDASILILAYGAAATMYVGWMGADSLSDITLLHGIFGSSDLTMADLYALVYTLVTCVLAHSLAYVGIVTKQQLMATEQLDWRSILWIGLGLACFLGLFVLFMYWWESPVLALRTGQMIGDAHVEKLLDDVTKIPSVSAITGSSWLLTTQWLMWPLLILFVAWGTTRSKLYFNQVIDPEPVIEQQSNETRQVAIPAAPPTEEIQYPQAQTIHTNGHASAAQVSQPNRSGAYSGPAVGPEHADNEDHGQVQVLIEQNEQQRQENDALRDQLRGAIRHNVSNPLFQPNRDDQTGEN